VQNGETASDIRKVNIPRSPKTGVTRHPEPRGHAKHFDGGQGCAAPTSGAGPQRERLRPSLGRRPNQTKWKGGKGLVGQEPPQEKP